LGGGEDVMLGQAQEVGETTTTAEAPHTNSTTVSIQKRLRGGDGLKEIVVSQRGGKLFSPIGGLWC